MYKEVHRFLVFDEIKKGKTVYCLDRQTKLVHTVNDLSADDMALILNEADGAPHRFEFWEEVDGLL